MRLAGPIIVMAINLLAGCKLMQPVSYLDWHHGEVHIRPAGAVQLQPAHSLQTETLTPVQEDSQPDAENPPEPETPPARPNAVGEVTGRHFHDDDTPVVDTFQDEHLLDAKYREKVQKENRQPKVQRRAGLKKRMEF